MKLYSITRRLIATVLLVEFVSAICVTGLAMVYEKHAHFTSFDVMLRGRADSLLGAVQDAGDEQDNVMLDGTGLDVPRRDIFEVRDADNRLLGRSPNWDGPTPADLASRSGDFLRLSVKGRRYRVLRLQGVRIVDPDDKGGGIPRHVTILYGARIDPVWESVVKAVEFYALTSLGLLLVTGVLMYWLLNRELEPLRQLAAQASGVSVNSWDFAPPDAARKTAELAPLALALETVLHGLRRSFLQQNRFISDAAHELKTAVAVTKSSLQLLAMKHRTAAEYEVGIEQCQSDCQRLEEIVAKMLTLARIENESAIVAAPSATDLVQCVRQVADEFETMAQINRLRIRIAVPERAIVNIEPEECRLLCSNLLLNAIQHSSPDSGIKLTVEGQGTTAELRVEDHGDGIDPSVLPHIFERFYRGDPSRSRKTGGTGLGLAICKAIALKFHGDIDISSQLGAGTTVIVRLPLAQPVHPLIAERETARP